MQTSSDLPQSIRLPLKRAPKRSRKRGGGGAVVLVVDFNLDRLVGEEGELQRLVGVGAPEASCREACHTERSGMELHISHGVARPCPVMEHVDGVAERGQVPLCRASPTGLEIPDSRLEPPGAVEAMQPLETGAMRRSEVQIDRRVGRGRGGDTGAVRVRRGGKGERERCG